MSVVTLKRKLETFGPLAAPLPWRRRSAPGFSSLGARWSVQGQRNLVLGGILFSVCSFLQRQLLVDREYKEGLRARFGTRSFSKQELGFELQYHKISLTSKRLKM